MKTNDGIHLAEIAIPPERRMNPNLFERMFSPREHRTLSPIGTIKPVRSGRLRNASYSGNMRPDLISPNLLRLSRRGHLALWFSND